MPHTVKLQHTGNQGYAPSQIRTRMTLGDLLSQLEEAIEEFGEDAVLVTYQTNNRYGASWGKLDHHPGMITSAEEEEDF